VAQFGNEPGIVIPIVRAERDPATRHLTDHHEGRVPFAVAIGQRHAGIDDQPRPVFHQQVPAIGELRGAPVALAIGPGIAIRRRMMRHIRRTETTTDVTTEKQSQEQSRQDIREITEQASSLAIRDQKVSFTVTSGTQDFTAQVFENPTDDIQKIADGAQRPFWTTLRLYWRSLRH
jgi:hypothetical protein